jgi:ferrous iron transport protein B
MREAALPLVAAAPSFTVALVGNPNCGKTALFNRLTGARQKVANYAGVTVERKIGVARLGDGRSLAIVDLPGTYSLAAATPDEHVAVEVIEGRRSDGARPDVVVAVVDATNLRMNLRLVLELRSLDLPMVVALNMADLARAQGVAIDTQRLAAELGCPVVETVAVRGHGHRQLLDLLATMQPSTQHVSHTPSMPAAADLQREVRRLLALVTAGPARAERIQHRVDAVAMHPVWGLVLLAATLFLVFQAVFAWAVAPMDAIKDAVAMTGEWLQTQMAEGPLRGLLVDGVIAGVGSVLVFLPQILILFFFILLLEDSGYLPRAAFLLDTVMGKVGLSGRAFIPLLSSFACAVPGIMATRTIANPRDRLATILIAPLMTCSARLPVYALLIGAFVPDRSVGGFNLRGLTLFALYAAGVLAAMAVAWVLNRRWLRSSYQPLMLELPPYRWPDARNLALGLWERTRIFLRRVGGIIFSLMVVLWYLSTYPAPPEGATGPAIQYSLAGQLGQLLLHVFAPIGFNWQISIALVPGLAAREVAVGALGTVYALSASGDAVAETLAPVIAQGWSLATAYALLAWYVFAPQCISTLAVARRQTGSWRVPLVMLVYLFAMAYAAAFVTYRVALALGGGP